MVSFYNAAKKAGSETACARYGYKNTPRVGRTDASPPFFLTLFIGGDFNVIQKAVYTLEIEFGLTRHFHQFFSLVGTDVLEYQLGLQYPSNILVYPLRWNMPPLIHGWHL